MTEGRSAERPGMAAHQGLRVHFKCVLRGHKQEVDDVRFSPNGELLASVANDGICLWSVSEQKVLYVIEEPTPSHIGFSADGTLLAYVVREGIVRLLKTNGDVVAELPNHEPNVTEVAFSTDGTLLVTGDITGRVCIRDLETRYVLCSFQGMPHHELDLTRSTTHGVGHFSFTPDGKRMAILSQDKLGPVQIWDIEESGTRVEWIGSVIEPRQAIWSMAFSPDGRFLAVTDVDRSGVWLFDAGSLTSVGMLSLPVADVPKSISFSPNGRFLAVAGGARGIVWIWNMDSQQIVTSFEAHTEGYAEGSQLWALGGIDWARTGGRIATSGASLGTFFDYRRQRFLGPDDYTVKLWDVQVED